MNSSKKVNDSISAILQILKDHGLRVTNARIAVIETLVQSSVPLDSINIYKEIANNSKDLNSIDQVSVYRVLQKLEELSLLHKVSPSGGYVLCLHHSCSKNYHVVLSCNNCKEINEIHVPDDISSRLFDYLKNKELFISNSHHFQIDGICKKCKKIK